MATLLAVLQTQPAWLARMIAQRMGPCPQVVFAASTGRREMALTFDDGPDPATTPALLSVLRQHAAHGTFFLIGSRAAAAPDLARQIVQDGHEVGNHLWEDRPSVLARPTRFAADLRRTQEALSSASGSMPTLVRPASGWFTPRMVRQVRQMGCRLALGSVAVHDIALRSPQRSLRFVVRRLQPGAVVVLHEHHPTASDLAGFVEALLLHMHNRGLVGVSLSRLLEPDSQPGEK